MIKENEQKERQRFEGIKLYVEKKAEVEAKLQAIINKIARLLDKQWTDSHCISCFRYPSKPQGGHFYTVQAFPALRYHLWNVHLQCYKCNCKMGSNRVGYEEGIIYFYGNKKLSYIKQTLPRTYPELRKSKEELREYILTARECLKKVENYEITTRDAVNKFIGIYK